MVNWYVGNLSWKNILPLLPPLEATADFVNHVLHRIWSFSEKPWICSTLTVCQSQMTCDNIKILLALNALKSQVNFILVEPLSYFQISGRYGSLWISVCREKACYSFGFFLDKIKRRIKISVICYQTLWSVRYEIFSNKFDRNIYPKSEWTLLKRFHQKVRQSLIYLNLILCIEKPL